MKALQAKARTLNSVCFGALSGQVRGAFLMAASHLNSRLDTLTASEEMQLALVIYTKPGCPYCDQARVHYNSHGIPFTEYDAQNDRARRKEMLAYSGGDPTVPCLVENGKYKGSGWGDPPRG